MWWSSQPAPHFIWVRPPKAFTWRRGRRRVIRKCSLPFTMATLSGPGRGDRREAGAFKWYWFDQGKWSTKTQVSSIMSQNGGEEGSPMSLVLVLRKGCCLWQLALRTVVLVLNCYEIGTKLFLTPVNNSFPFKLSCLIMQVPTIWNVPWTPIIPASVSSDLNRTSCSQWSSP